MFWSTLLFGELNHTVSMILVDPFDIYSYTLDRSMFWSTLLIGVTLCQRSWLTLFSYTHIHWIGQCFGRLFCSEVSRLGTISGSPRRLNGKEWVRYFIIFYDILWYDDMFSTLQFGLFSNDFEQIRLSMERRLIPGCPALMDPPLRWFHKFRDK